MPPNFAEYYDAVINWEKRLGREMPLLEELARSAGPRVLVPACGTGGHVAALAERGFSVLGFDADEDMVAFARQRIHHKADVISAAGSEAKVSLLRMEQGGELVLGFHESFPPFSSRRSVASRKSSGTAVIYQ